MTELQDRPLSLPYPKIPGPFMRNADRTQPGYNKVIYNEWTHKEFELLQFLPWWWTEKIDGMNIRVFWDGVTREFRGRTDKATIPGLLQDALEKLFLVDQLEQVFQATPVTFYGEGYGGKIQKGGNYRPDESFILFDVRIGDWQTRDTVREIGQKLSIPVVPHVLTGSIWDAIHFVNDGFRSRVAAHDIRMEGLIGVPHGDFRTRGGERIITKVKDADYGPDAHYS